MVSGELSRRASPPAVPLRRGRPRGPRRSREERREELLDGAERAIRRIGPQASMEELAAEAGITKPILYSHFGDRAGLADALAVRTADLLIATLGDSLDQAVQAGDPHDVVTSAFEAFCSFIESEPSIYRFLVRSSLDEPNPVISRLVTQIASRISSHLERAMRYAGVDPSPAEAWGFSIVGMGFVAAEWWLDRRSMAKQDLIEHLTNLVWGGLAGAGFDRLATEPRATEPRPTEPRPTEPRATEPRPTEPSGGSRVVRARRTHANVEVDQRVDRVDVDDALQGPV